MTTCVCAAHLTDSEVLPFAMLGSDGAPMTLVVQRYKTVGETVCVSVEHSLIDDRVMCASLLKKDFAVHCSTFNVDNHLGWSP